jgi:hypothetical protein
MPEIVQSEGAKDVEISRETAKVRGETFAFKSFHVEQPTLAL